MLRVLSPYFVCLLVLLVVSYGKLHAESIYNSLSYHDAFFREQLCDTVPARPIHISRTDSLLYQEEFFCQASQDGGLYFPWGIENGNLPITKQPPLLSVKGNILYDVNYRSRLDTPYAENNVYQHTIQTRLDFVYKGQYPFKLYLTAHFGNSPLFRKYFDLNFSYTRNDFVRLMKQNILQAGSSYLMSRFKTLDSLKQLIDAKRLAILSLRATMPKTDPAQKIVEEREKSVFENGNRSAGNGSTFPSVPGFSLNTGDSSKSYYKKEDSSLSSNLILKKKSMTSATDTIPGKLYSYENEITEKEKKLDSLSQDLQKLMTTYNQVKSLQQANQEQWTKNIEGARDLNGLKDGLHQMGIPDSVLPKGYQTLYAIRSFSVGRSVVNYSELSVKNVSITGVQAEYNPNYYYAFAAGKITYQFQDFVVPNSTGSNQSVALVRFGKGMKDGNHIIFTYYTGKRQYFNSSIVSPAVSTIPSYLLSGYTLEGLFKLSRNISLTAEVAKSTGPYYSPDSAQSKNWRHSLFSFNDHSNEAYSVKLNSYFPQTFTRFSASYNYMGASFESFSTFSTGASQKRWQMRLEQPFFKRQLTVISSVQQNEYYNPFVATTFSSSAVLASFQANLRIRKWPYLSLGYFPSYQLTKISDNEFSENRYYTLVANAGYSYRYHSLQMSTTAIYSKFYNAPSDSGFVYFNAENFLVSQFFFLKRFTFQFDGSLSANIGYNIYTIANNDQVAINNLISVGGGWKMIRESLEQELQWGYSGNVTLNFRRLGSIQLMMDKGFIPGPDKKLVENNMGRLTYYKTF